VPGFFNFIVEDNAGVKLESGKKGILGLLELVIIN